MTNNLPIGIFDSGVGGLTVMRAIADALPGESLLYLGDTARVPYGNRSPETIRRYAINATTMLVEEGVKALVIACNTASAYALDALRARFDLPIVGVVHPVAARAAELTRTGAVGVIGTRGTVASGCYDAALRSRGVREVVQQPCPLFVPLAEEGWTRGRVPSEVAQKYLSVFAHTDVDTLILGCTHYPLLADTIAEVFEAQVHHPARIVDSASATADALRATLDAQALHATAAPQMAFCATDDPRRFEETATRFFGAHVQGVRHVDIIDTSLTSPANP